MPAPMTRSTAQLWTFVAQGAGAVALLAGAAMFVFAPASDPTRDGRLDAASRLDTLTDERRASMASAEPTDTDRPADLESIAFNLSQLPNAPAEVEDNPPPAPDEEDENEGEGELAQTEDPLSRRYEFMGAVTVRTPAGVNPDGTEREESIRHLAIIRWYESGEQSILRVGSDLGNDVRIIGVTPDEVVLEHAGMRTQIGRTDRAVSGVSRSYVEGGSPAPSGASPVFNPSADGSVRNPGEERRRRIEQLRQQGGITPQRRLGVDVADPRVPQGDDQIRAYRENLNRARGGGDQ